MKKPRLILWQSWFRCCPLPHRPRSPSAFASPPISAQFVIELQRDRAPLTVENFLTYVRSGHYTNTLFHRVIAGFVIQGGGVGTDYKAKPISSRFRTSRATGSRICAAPSVWRAPPGPTPATASSTSTWTTTHGSRSAAHPLGLRRVRARRRRHGSHRSHQRVADRHHGTVQRGCAPAAGRDPEDRDARRGAAGRAAPDAAADTGGAACRRRDCATPPTTGRAAHAAEVSAAWPRCSPRTCISTARHPGPSMHSSPSSKARRAAPRRSTCSVTCSKSGSATMTTIPTTRAPARR